MKRLVCCTTCLWAFFVEVGIKETGTAPGFASDMFHELLLMAKFALGFMAFVFVAGYFRNKA